jgi:hypothetical protein
VHPNFGADPELFDLPALVLFARFLQLLFALITKLGEIGKLADRRVVQWSDFDKIRALVLGNSDGFFDRLNP